MGERNDFLKINLPADQTGETRKNIANIKKTPSIIFFAILWQDNCSDNVNIVPFDVNDIRKTCVKDILTHKAPPTICSRRQFQILQLFQK